MWGPILRLLTLILLAWSAWHLSQGLSQWNYDTHLAAPYETCEPIHVAAGSEDAVIFSHSPPILWVAAADHESMTTSHVTEGHIYQVDLTTKKSTKIPVRGLTSQVFHPHGISLIDVAGSKILFVVNHQHQGQAEQIIILEWKAEDGVLQHVETVEDEKFVNLNAVQGLTPRTFYATNDHGYPRNTLMFILSTLFSPLSRSSVVYWNGRVASYAVPPGGFRMANGISLSNNGDSLYVADSTANSVHVYRTSAADRAALLLDRQIPLPSGPDNIRVDTDGSLYIGTVPNVLRFIWHVLDWRNHAAPAQVLRVQFMGSGQGSTLIETLYQSNGDQISTSSTSLRVGGPQDECQRLVISPVFQDHILVCSSHCDTV